ncbi:hypothetical protein AF333_10475 [Aneurinibacillus migulanus]|uniref:Glycosyl hydrolases family 2, sugar binding domain n=1 Tax=Aneurinibacillus migulanus TaxID=47500 RepID=A0A0M0H2B2_ANEMI|nr:hypothetical protein AF333_10475 [Aneurinibacillus migulanus]
MDLQKKVTSKKGTLLTKRKGVKRLLPVRKMTSLIKVVRPNATTVIGTDESWFNAIEISRESFWVPTNTAKWVWGANDPFGAAAVVSRRFRIRRVRDVINATLFFAVDNYGVVLINGRPVINDIKQNTPRFFMNGRTIDISDFLRSGVNDIVIVGFNFGGPGTGFDLPRSATNPAGILARLTIET